MGGTESKHTFVEHVERKLPTFHEYEDGPIKLDNALITHVSDLPKRSLKIVNGMLTEDFGRGD